MEHPPQREVESEKNCACAITKRLEIYRPVIDDQDDTAVTLSGCRQSRPARCKSAAESTLILHRRCCLADYNERSSWWYVHDRGLLHRLHSHGRNTCDIDRAAAGVPVRTATDQTVGALWRGAAVGCRTTPGCVCQNAPRDKSPHAYQLGYPALLQLDAAVLGHMFAPAVTAWPSG